MTLAVWQGLAAQESSGNIVVLASPTVTITDRATGAQPSLFSDRAGSTGIGNPFTANADGSIEFYVAPGRYKVEATKGGDTVTWDNVLIAAGDDGGRSLETDDLAANGGTIPEEGRSNDFGQTTQKLDGAGGVWRVYISNDSDQVVFEVTDSNTNKVGQIFAKNLDGAGGGSLNIALFDDVEISGASVLKAPTTSSDPGLAFDTWRTPNANRPTFVTVDLFVDTTFGTTAEIKLEVDESGGTTADYEFRCWIQGGQAIQNISTTIPAGGAYRILNVTDPNTGSNGIGDHRELTL